MTMFAATSRVGLLAGLGAYLVWGLLPLYLKLLTGVPAADVLAFRILWSMLVMAAVVLVVAGGARLRAVLANRRLMLLLLASSVCIAVNWLIYTWAILNGHVLDTSLGYFINPLISIGFGVVLLGERLTIAQWLAVGFAVAGVAVTTIAHGEVPLIALGLAVSFALYGLIRKHAGVDAVTGLFVETLVLAPVAAVWLASQPTGIFDRPLPLMALLAAGGALSALPLLLFGVATRHLKLSTLGLMQYLAPSMVFLQAVFVFGETLDPWRMLAFALIWTGLAVYAVSLAKGARGASVGIAARPLVTGPEGS
jgi:chloramphenicol-sensitive protein RarD